MGGGLIEGNGCLDGGPFNLLSPCHNDSGGTPAPQTVVLGAGAGWLPAVVAVGGWRLPAMLTAGILLIKW